MRAVFISHAYVTRHSRGKLRALAGLGCTVAVAVPDRWTDRGGAGRIDAQWEDDGGIRVVPVSVRGDLSAPPALRWDGRALRRLLKDFRPDLIQIEEEPWSRAAARVAAEARRLRIPCVVFTWSSLPRPLTVAERLRRARVYKSVAGVIAGNRLADALVARVRPQLPRVVIPQIGVAAPSSASTAGGPLAIGFVGRLVPEKGLDTLFRACVKLLGDWTLDVVGTGPAQVELESLAERLGIAARVTWHGALPRPERAAVQARLGCLVMPSRATRDWVETHGGPAIEAMAQGIPVVVSDTGALRELVGEGGLVVPEDDVTALAAALQRLVDDPSDRADLGAEGRRRVIGHFSNEALARRLLEFWRGVLA
jgi:glycosyltransferase involved in cell wall biosynthesis